MLCINPKCSIYLGFHDHAISMCILWSQWVNSITLNTSFGSFVSITILLDVRLNKIPGSEVKEVYWELGKTTNVKNRDFGDGSASQKAQSKRTWIASKRNFRLPQKKVGVKLRKISLLTANFRCSSKVPYIFIKYFNKIHLLHKNVALHSFF